MTEQSNSAGHLFIVATPIGNLEDITFRAIRVLKEVDLVLAEDTRRTKQLFNHFGIGTKLRAFHAHNSVETTPQIIEMLRSGMRLALVSDAGTPLVSDPGSDLVVAASDANIRIEPIPGACAAVAALSAAGLRSDRFRFIGFPARKGAKKNAFVETCRNSRETVIAYESPKRLVDTLQTLIDSELGERHCVVARELTKTFEEFKRGSIHDVHAYFAEREIKGEITLMIAPNETQEEDADDATLIDALNEALERGLSKKDASKEVAKLLGVPKKRAYQLALSIE